MSFQYWIHHFFLHTAAAARLFVRSFSLVLRNAPIIFCGSPPPPSSTTTEYAGYRAAKEKEKLFVFSDCINSQHWTVLIHLWCYASVHMNRILFYFLKVFLNKFLITIFLMIIKINVQFNMLILFKEFSSLSHHHH